MTEQSTDERALAAALGSYVAGMQADPDLYLAVRRWRRRRRQLTGALAAVVVLLVTAVPLAAYRLANRAGENHHSAAPQPAPLEYVHQNGVRGSLGGNQQLLDEAHAAFMLKEKHGSPWPEQIVPVYAERDPQHDVTIVLFSGTARNDERAFGVWATRVGSGSWDVVENATAVSTRDPKAAAQTHERIWGDPLWIQTVDVGQLSLEYLAIVVPVGSDAEIGSITDVASSGVEQFNYDPLELHAGTALLKLSGRGSTKIMIFNNRDLVTSWTYGIRSGGIYYVDGALSPRQDQVAAAAQHARGHVEVDSDAVQDAVRDVSYLQQYRDLHMTFRIIWGGVIDKQPCVLTAMEFDSGALAPLLTCHEADGRSNSTWPGPVRAGSFDHTAVAWNADLVTNEIAPCYVMAPPGAVRAEVEYADHTRVPVTLDNGFGVARHHGRAVTARVYDGAGHLLDQARVDHNVTQ